MDLRGSDRPPAAAYWDEIERRLLYALENYPHIQFQLIPYEPFGSETSLQGMHGYLTAVRDGRLDDGAADFRHIKTFFAVNTKLRLR